MQFLKILFWALVAGIATAFSVNNWAPVQIRLWGGLVADVNLPFLLLVTFLIGFLPVFLAHHAIRWRMRQRLASAERALSDLRASQLASVTPPPAIPEVVDMVPATPPPPITPSPTIPGIA